MFTWNDKSSWQGVWNKDEPEGSGTYVVFGNQSYAQGGWNDDDKEVDAEEEEEEDKGAKKPSKYSIADNYYDDDDDDDDDDADDEDDTVTVFAKGPTKQQREESHVPDFGSLDRSL